MKKLETIVRTHRKEVQFSDEEFKVVCDHAHSAGLQPAVYIREASLKHQLTAAMSAEERKLYQRATAISSRFLNNLNQLMHLANTFHFSAPLKKAIMLFVKRADGFMQGKPYEPIDTAILESELRKEENKGNAPSSPVDSSKVKSLEEENTKLKAEVERYQDKNSRLSHEIETVKVNAKEKLDNDQKIIDLASSELEKTKKLALKYYYYSKKGEDEFIKKHGIILFPNNNWDKWFMKTDEKEISKDLPTEIWKPWRAKEISIADVYDYYIKYLH